MKNNKKISEFVENLEEATMKIRSELISDSIKLLLHEINHREKKKFKHRATPCENLNVNDVVFSRQDFIESGSLGLSLMNIVSVNRACTQAIVQKARPAHKDSEIYKKSMSLTRSTDELYMIVNSHQNLTSDTNTKVLDISELTKLQTNKLGAIIDSN